MKHEKTFLSIIDPLISLTYRDGQISPLVFIRLLINSLVSKLIFINSVFLRVLHNDEVDLLKSSGQSPSFDRDGTKIRIKCR